MSRNKVVGVVIPIILLLIAAGVGAYFFLSEDEIRKRPKGNQKILVEVQKISRGDHQISLEVMGKVIPFRQVSLRSLISGEVVSVSKNLIQGGIVKKGELLVEIDKRDYELSVKEKRASLLKAESALMLEGGQQKIAEHEFSLVPDNENIPSSSKDLMLRKPQLLQAQANYEIAQVALENAELNLGRTQIKAPWSGVVLDTDIVEGAMLSSGGVVAKISDYTKYWVQVEVPHNKVKYLDFSKKDSAEIYFDSNIKIKGRVSHLLGELDSSSLLVPLIVEAKNPNLKSGNNNNINLLIGDYRKVKIDGKKIQDCFKVKKEFVKEGGKVWVFDSGKLQIKNVDLINEDAEYYFFNADIKDNSQIVVTNIQLPVDGMELFLASSAENTSVKNKDKERNSAIKNRKQK